VNVMVEYKAKSENYAETEIVDDLQHGIVVAKNLTKIYGSGTTSVAALKGVNLNVQQGEFVAVLGPSGSFFKPIIWYRPWMLCRTCLCLYCR